ncbi:MAG TPA: glycine cleavage system protein GcvH [Terriglobia bacterium]|jgi:glycine cleavage system H protein|nr:glycine cleavage system protein GcvH [Terriglobia bacterium]
MYPPELLYTKDHEWIRVDGEIGTLGITDHAQKELGDIVFVELPKRGDQVTAHETFGSVESVKAVSEIFSPVTGEVTSVNSRISDRPELVNEDPHGEAWLIKVQLKDHRETESLMTADQYEAYIEGSAAASAAE